ncbi:MAG TPA: AAA family ATPase, partial [Chlamydiales bacterium]|nr:AAA family ATPase [Chlamydiales bacterium]
MKQSSHNRVARIAIVGTSGSGKTTVAQQLSTILGCDHIELDAYAWNPGWVKKEDSIIVNDIQKVTQKDSWVICGNYSVTREIVWARATHIVWLNLPVRIILWRLFKRTI